MTNYPIEETEETWVSATEAGEITGYHRDYVQRLARNNWLLPEQEREIRVRKRLRGYDIWLPDLKEYQKKIRRGPQPKRKHK